jgi:hypothetical protein
MVSFLPRIFALPLSSTAFSALSLLVYSTNTNPLLLPFYLKLMQMIIAYIISLSNYILYSAILLKVVLKIDICKLSIEASNIYCIFLLLVLSLIYFFPLIFFSLFLLSYRILSLLFFFLDYLSSNI